MANLQAVFRFLQKQADAYSRMPDPKRYSGLALARAESPEESKLFGSEKSKLFPAILPSPGDPISADMASPTKGALLYGTLAGMVGAAVGKGTARFAGKVMPEHPIDENKAMAYTGMATAVLAAMAAWLHRHEKNEDLQDLTLRLPPGATRRDMDNNPFLASQEDPEAIQRIAALNAALRGNVSRPERAHA